MSSTKCRTWSDRLYIRLPRKDIAVFKFLLESYENLAILSVVDRYEAIVQLRFAGEQREELLAALAGLTRDVHLEVLNLPRLELPE